MRVLLNNEGRLQISHGLFVQYFHRVKIDRRTPTSISLFVQRSADDSGDISSVSIVIQRGGACHSFYPAALFINKINAASDEPKQVPMEIHNAGIKDGNSHPAVDKRVKATFTDTCRFIDLLARKPPG